MRVDGRSNEKIKEYYNDFCGKNLRLFLIQKLAKQIANKGSKAKSTREKNPARNRRLHERFNFDHKHLTMLNERDIFQIREISQHGFSTWASPRAIERMSVNDAFQARIKHLGETQDVDIRVSWKTEDTIGFEIPSTESALLSFIQRLLKPSEIASSLRVMEADFLQEHHHGKTWYHGDHTSDIYVWRDSEGSIDAWQIVWGDQYAAWSRSGGVSTGCAANAFSDSMSAFTDAPQLSFAPDDNIDLHKVQFALDVTAASNITERDFILSTIPSKARVS
jgi:hypothetical protein